MMDASVPAALGCAGIALIVTLAFWSFMIVPLWQDIRDAWNGKRAAADLPALARELGLGRVQGGGTLGAYRGELEGHEIRIEPHEYHSLTITLERNPGFAVTHFGVIEPHFGSWPRRALFVAIVKVSCAEGPGSDTGGSFDFDDPALNRYFTAREQFLPHANALIRDREVNRALLDSIAKNRSRVKSLTVGAEIGCALWTGGGAKPRYRSVTAAQARLMLPELLRIAEALEKAIRWNTASLNGPTDSE
ncbi:MAG: hypothetical protein JXA20_11245 [Spirochaetes bacterium]|nr:hypothetical protein [Spirochaetota bacterium]